MIPENELIEELQRALDVGRERTGDRFQRPRPDGRVTETLRAIHSLAATSYPAWEESFFAFIGHFSEDHEHQPLAEAPDRLRQAMLEYFPSLFLGPFDETRNRLCLQIGLWVHQSAVNPFIFTSGIMRLMGGSVDFLREHLAPEAADLDVLAFYDRMLLLDASVMVESLFRLDRRLRDRLAHLDPRTKLWNEKKLREELELRLQPGRPRFALALFGLRRLRQMLDSLDAGAGDRLLREIAGRLFPFEESGVFVARGGEESFAVLCDPDAVDEGFDTLVGHVRSQLDAPYQIDGMELRLESAAGVLPADHPERDAGALLALCATALHRALAETSPVISCDQSVERFSLEDLQLIRDLSRAIRTNELVLHYQPQIEFETGQIAGAEALVRWIHPTKGSMPPGRFITLAEKTLLIHALTERILRDAIRQARAWESAGMPVTVAVNLSTANLHNPELPALVERLLKESGLSPALLSLEVTDAAILAAPREAAAALAALRALGIRIAIDDFGLGYSSMAFLRELPVDEVKIDRSFIFGMLKDPRDASIVEATIRLCLGLGLAVSAEGIEDEATYTRLQNSGCTFAQGFYLARPMPADQLEGWIRARAQPSEATDPGN